MSLPLLAQRHFPDSTPIVYLKASLFAGPTTLSYSPIVDTATIPHEMRLFSGLLCALVAPTLIAATALTYRLSPSETACFFALVETAGSKIAFYFAVRAHLELFCPGKSYSIFFASFPSKLTLFCPRVCPSGRMYLSN